jgi:RNA polymerase sigma-54 factor
MADIGLRLEIKQAQKLLMTPSLQMAIKLLQLTKLDLVQAVRQELVENPLLEEVSPDVSSTEEEEESSPSSEDELSASVSSPEIEAGEPEPEQAEPSLSEVDWEQYFSDDDRNIERYSNYENKEITPSWESTLAKSPSIQEHLSWQLRLVTHTPEEQKIGEVIVGNIDDNGYLQASVEEIAEAVPADKAAVGKVLRLIQSLEPTGVGARNLEECLLLQVKGSDESAQLLREIIRRHLGNLEKKKYPAIATDLKIPLKRVVELAQVIAGYDPKPGRRFNAEQARYVIPDVFVYKLDDDYVIIVNDEGIPRLRVSKLYRKILRKGSDISQGTRKYIDEKFRSALWLIKSIHQRQATLYKVTESIVKFQRDFLDNGIAGLKPLTLKDVASDIGMHESTVSRVTTNKYVQTPRGIFELKYFFHSGLETNTGYSMSSVRIRDIIKKIVEGEDKTRPLTDIQIHRILKQRGINIARRTITKYREALNIGPASRRKEF